MGTQRTWHTLGTLPVWRKGGNVEKETDGHRQCPAGNLSNHLMLLMAFRAQVHVQASLSWLYVNILVPSTAQVKLLSH